MTDFDPTYVVPDFNPELESIPRHAMQHEIGDWNNPFKMRMSGTAIHGMTPFDVPYISLLDEGDDEYSPLYHGGCDGRLVLPIEIDNVISLYRWEEYKIRRNHEPWIHTVTMYDEDAKVDRDAVIDAANKTNEMRRVGSTLVHCQAGLNRSSLVAGVSLILLGRDPNEVIETMRKRRSPAVLCNPSFERFVRSFND